VYQRLQGELLTGRHSAISAGDVFQDFTKVAAAP
jgi:hypothetical protein